MGKILNSTPSQNLKEVPIMMVLRVVLKGILKAYRLISSLMKYQRNFGKLEIKYKIGLRLFLSFISGTQNICGIYHSVYCRFEGKEK